MRTKGSLLFARVFHSLLILVALVGLVALARAAKTEQELRRERDHLARQYGSLAIDDPSKFYLQRIALPERAHFLWRAYVPETGKLVVKHRVLSHSGTRVMRYADGNGLIRLRIGPRDGQFRSFVVTQGSSSSGSFANPEELSEFLWEHWDELEIETAGDHGALMSDMSTVVTLLSVKVPEYLQQQAIQEVPDADRHQLAKRLAGPIVQLRCGTEAAFVEEELER